MRFRSAGVIVARGIAPLVALAALGAGCGEDDDDQARDPLVSMHAQGTLDFRLDPDDGPEHVVELDEGVEIDRDGDGTRTSSSFDGKREFRVSPSRLEGLEDALDELDLDFVEENYGAEGGDAATTTLSYDGRTVMLGDQIAEVDAGEGEEQADLLNEVTSEISTLSAEALPGEIRRANRQTRRGLRDVREVDR